MYTEKKNPETAIQHRCEEKRTNQTTYTGKVRGSICISKRNAEPVKPVTERQLPAR